jgi:hypothetical protein
MVKVDIWWNVTLAYLQNPIFINPKFNHIPIDSELLNLFKIEIGGVGRESIAHPAFSINTTIDLARYHHASHSRFMNDRSTYFGQDFPSTFWQRDSQRRDALRFPALHPGCLS